MKIDVLYCPELDKAIVSLPVYPGQPTEVFFDDGRYDFSDDYIPF
jgi:hypothetical protein